MNLAEAYVDARALRSFSAGETGIYDRRYKCVGEFSECDCDSEHDAVAANENVGEGRSGKFVYLKAVHLGLVKMPVRTRRNR